MVAERLGRQKKRKRPTLGFEGFCPSVALWRT